ncbi:LamG-like jellyroll fold domain-containing protein, partial [Seonamhaeicola marinus]
MKKTLLIFNFFLMVTSIGFSQEGSHLNFDGVNDQVNIGNSMNSALSGVTEFTIEAVVRPETISGLGVIVGNYNTGSGGMQFLLRRDLNRYNFLIDDGTGLIQVDFEAAQVNQWTHIAGVLDGSEIRIYIDGVLQDTTIGVAGSGFPNNTNPILIGRNNINENFDGDIDEIRIWTVARTQSEINSNKDSELLGNEAGLLAYYNFNQGNAGGNNSTETTLNDITSNNYDGTLGNFALTGTTSNWLEGSPVPNITNALNFDGINDQVNLGNNMNSLLEGINTFTVEAFVRPETTSGLGVVVGNYATGNNNMQFVLRRDLERYSFIINDGSGLKQVDFEAAQVGTWTHVAGVWDGSEMRIYIDGTLKDTTTGVIGAGLIANNNPVTMGRNNINENFDGDIDEVRIWTVARTQSEINTSKNTGLLGSESGLLAYYNFNQGIPGGNNISEVTLNDLAQNSYNGTLTNFTLTGNTSNWVSNQCASLAASISSQTNVSCNGLSDGGATVTASGGAAPYTYVWSNGATTAGISGVASGTYTVTV